MSGPALIAQGFPHFPVYTCIDLRATFLGAFELPAAGVPALRWIGKNETKDPTCVVSMLPKGARPERFDPSNDA